MFSRTKPKYQIMLESELEQALRVLKTHETGSEEYVQTLDYVERLYDMIDDNQSVSKDTLVTVGANLLGIIMILKHEFLNPINSKALNFVMRLR